MTTRRNQHAPLPRIKMDATVSVSQLLLDVMRQRQIQIVSAEQQMISHGHAMKLQSTRVTRSNMNQTEVRCASTDVTDQDLLTR